MTTHRSPRPRALQLLIGISAALVAAAVTVPAEAATSSPSPSPSASSSAATPQPVTFGVQTATATAIDARGLFSYGVTPGATLIDHVAFVNYSVKPIDITVYPADAYNTPDDGFALLTQQEHSKDAGSWIKLGISGQKLRLPGRLAKGPYIRIVTVTLHVPADADPGDHTAGIVASFQGLAKTSQGDVIKLNQRVGTRVLVRVSGPLHPGVSIQGLTAGWGGSWAPLGSGHVDVSYRVHNSGNVRLAGVQQLTVKGWVGSTKVGPGNFALLLPDNTVNTQIAVKHIFPGFRVKVTVRVQPVAAPGDAPLLAHVATATTTVWAIPWTGLACILLVLLGGWWLLRRRRRKTQQPKPPIAGQRKPTREAVAAK
jgi:LPXTG-motif cell wall-anchored protein